MAHYCLSVAFVSSLEQAVLAKRDPDETALTQQEAKDISAVLVKALTTKEQNAMLKEWAVKFVEAFKHWTSLENLICFFGKGKIPGTIFGTPFQINDGVAGTEQIPINAIHIAITCHFHADFDRAADPNAATTALQRIIHGCAIQHAYCVSEKVQIALYPLK